MIFIKSVRKVKSLILLVVLSEIKIVTMVFIKSTFNGIGDIFKMKGKGAFLKDQGTF